MAFHADRQSLSIPHYAPTVQLEMFRTGVFSDFGDTSDLEHISKNKDDVILYHLTFFALFSHYPPSIHSTSTMDTKITCPHCNTQYEFDPALVGQNVECANCKKNFQVSNPNLRQCPDCFQNISVHASQCPHCGHVFQVTSTSSVGGISSASQAVPYADHPEETLFTITPAFSAFFTYYLLGIILIPFLIGLLVLLFTYLAQINTRYIITTQRIITRKGILSKQQTEVWVRDMRGLNLTRSLWDLLCGTGTISIGTAATAGAEILMHGVKDAQNIIDRVNQIRATMR